MMTVDNFLKIKSIVKLMEVFSNEQKCLDFLEEIIWNGNPVSPFDGTSKVYKCTEKNESNTV